jgi:hypothetical protein
MRRVFVALAVFGLTAAAPLLARGDDAEIKRQIINRLKQQQAAGRLEGFDIGLKVEAGVVYVKGRVVSPAQEKLVLETAARTPGVAKVLKNIQIGEAAPAASQTAVQQPEGVARGFSGSGGSTAGAGAISQPESVAGQTSRRATPQQDPMALRPGAPSPIRIESAPAYPATSNAQLVLNPHAGAPAPQVRVSPEAEAAATPLRQSGAQEDGNVLRASASQPQQQTAAGQPQRQVATQQPQTAAASQGLQPAAQPQLAPVNPYYQHPYAAYYAAMAQTPRAFAPAQQASAETAASAGAAGAAAGPYGPAGFAPPIHPVSGGAFSGGGVRYDHPQLPPYAWPSYASHPNYAAVTYPKQYSPTVWPYIGPFYPYPQVPLGWRKVCLEWDDGWWQLDFKDQSRPWTR